MGGEALRVAAASPALLLLPHVQPPEPPVLVRIVVSTKPAAWPSLSVGSTTVTMRWTFPWGGFLGKGQEAKELWQGRTDGRVVDQVPGLQRRARVQTWNFLLLLHPLEDLRMEPLILPQLPWTDTPVILATSSSSLSALLTVPPDL